MSEIAGNIELACAELYEVVIESDGLKTTYRASSPHAIRFLMQAVSEHRMGLPIEPAPIYMVRSQAEARARAMRTEIPL